MWRRGICSGPDGDVRQIPTKYSWNMSYWVNTHGTIRKRFWNASTQKWHWDSDAMQLVEETTGHGNLTGRLGIILENSFKSVEMCIALAWLPRREGSKAHIVLQDNMPLEKRYLHWSDGGECVDESPINGENFKPLTNWRCGCVPIPQGYEISNFGRLRYHGEVTSGFVFDETRLASVPQCGLVDLYAAAKIRRVLDIAPRIKTALDCLLSGHSPEDLAACLLVTVDTAWQYCWDAARHMPPAKIRTVAYGIVSHDLLKLLREMFDTFHPLVGGRLKDLMADVHGRLPSNSPFFKSETQFAQLRFAKMYIESTI